MRFVPHYSDIAAPLTKLNKKQYAYDFQRYWLDRHDRAFDLLVTQLTTALALALYDKTRAIRIETDASNIGMGAVLHLEVALGEWRPVKYWSRRFNSAQRIYHIAERETSAFVYALSH